MDKIVDERLNGLKSHKIEFFPDMDDDGKNLGPCALVMHFHKPNSKRFASMNQMDKQRCVSLIIGFEKSLSAMKKQIIDTYE